MQDDQKISEGKPATPKKPAVYFMLFELGVEFAFIIALPLLAFIYGGKWLDAKTGHNFYVIIGILLAIALSSYMIYRKIVEVRNMMKQ